MPTVDPVQVVFQVGGLAEVLNAFRSIEAAMAALEKKQRGFEERVTRPPRQRPAAGAAPGGEADELAKTRATERETKKRADAWWREAERAANAEIRAAERAEQARVKAAERADAQRASSRNRMVQSMYEVETRAADKAARVAAQAQARDQRAAAKAHKELQAGIGRGVGLVGGAISGVAGTAIRLGAGALALGGGFGLADAVTSSLSAERAAIAVSNSAYLPGVNQRVDPATIMAQAKAVQATTNIDKGELLEGLQGYVAKSSDLAGGMQNMDFFARLAKGSGTKFSDITNAAGMLVTQNEGLKNNPDQLRSMLRDIVGQGKLGAVEISDLASIAGKVTASSGMYGGDQATTQRRLLGLSQIAIKTSGSPEEAATTVSRLGSDALAHQDALKHAGVQVADAGGKLLDPATILANVMAKTGGNLGTIGGLGFGERSIRMFEALSPTYEQAERARKGSGGEAVRTEVNRFANAGYSDADMNADFAATMKARGEALEAAVTRIREVLADKAAPMLDRFAEKLPDLLPKIEMIIDETAKLASWLADNPLQGAIAVLGAAIVKDVAAAGIGKGVTAALVGLVEGMKWAVGQGAPGGLPVPGAGGLPVPPVPPVPLAVPIVVGAATGAALGAGAVAVESARQVGAQRGAAQAVLTGINAVDHADTSTPEGRSRAQSVAAQLRRDIDETKEKREHSGPGFLVGALGELTGQGGDMRDAQRTQEAAYTLQIKTLQEALEQLEKKLRTTAGNIPENAVAQNDPRRNTSMGDEARGGASR